MPKYTDAGEFSPKEKAVTLSEIGASQEIIPVTESIVASDKLEALQFSNDILTIVVHESSNEGDSNVVTPTVEGANQPIIRGVESKVKRKYVEVLARCRTPRIDQYTPDPMRPDQIMVRENQSLTYPFSVVHDPSPKGRAWLQSILSERM